jgi:hypothetical protein
MPAVVHALWALVHMLELDLRLWAETDLYREELVSLIADNAGRVALGHSIVEEQARFLPVATGWRDHVLNWSKDSFNRADQVLTSLGHEPQLFEPICLPQSP